MVDELDDRRTELLQRRMVELHFPLDARSPNDAKILARLDRVLEQRGLADSGVSMHDEDGATTAARSLQKPVEHGALGLPSEQPLRLLPDGHPGSMPPWRRPAEWASSPTDFPDANSHAAVAKLTDLL